MILRKQLIYTLALLVFSQLIGQLLPPFSIMFGTPMLVPVGAILINYVFAADRQTQFAFERKALIVIAVSVASGMLDYYYAPGTHDQVGFAWMCVCWLAGMFIICLGLTLVKFLYYIRINDLKANAATFVHVIEILLLLIVPIALAVIAMRYYI